MLWLYAHKHVSDPHDERVVPLEDDSEIWSKLLDNPEPIPPGPDGEALKEASSVLCGARYFDEAKTRSKDGVSDVTCLVLDVDCPATPSGHVPDRAALETALTGLRAIVYASPSHTTAAPRWRVLLPLLSPLPPRKHRALVLWLSEHLVEGYPGCIDAAATGDPCRLGFVGVTRHPADYVWWQQTGVRFDWTVLPLADETWTAAPLSGMERSTLWSDRATALKRALRRFATAGQGVGKGEGRTRILWETAMQLWWAWAAEDEDFVLTVLRQVNANFAQPEAEDELVRKMSEAHQRTIGERRVAQGSGSYGLMREPSDVISIETVKVLARRYLQRRDPELVVLGSALRRMTRGETLADDVETWRGLLSKLAQKLAEAFPTETPQRIAAFFRPSLAAMRATGAVVESVESIEAWIETRQAALRRIKDEQEARADASQRAQIEYATQGERNEAYTRDEEQAWAQQVGLRRYNWILVSKRAFYVFRNGTWVGPYTREEFEAQVYKDLAAAAPLGVRTQTFNVDKGTWANVPVQKLIQDYGSSCTTRVDLVCERSYFDVDDNTLVLAGPSRRPLEAKFHPAVDEYYRQMFGRPTPATLRERQEDARAVKPAGSGDDFDNFLDWQASMLAVDRPLVAAYIRGNTGVGKNLLVDGIGRIWRTGPIGLEDAFSHFNALILESPLVWIDEGLPPEMKASTLLRRAISAREFTYTRKHVDSGKAVGALRLIFTANNLDLFNRSKEMLIKEDVDALSQRFVHFHVRPEAKTYLESISPAHHAFVEKNMIAEHLLWLHDARWPAIQRRGLRFLVQSSHDTAADISDVIATNGEVASACCLKIAQTIMDLANTSLRVDWLVCKDGDVLVNAAGLHTAMLTTMNGTGRFRAEDVARALAGLAGKSRVVYHEKSKKTSRSKPLRLTALRAWVDNNSGLFEWDDVKAAIEKSMQYEKNKPDVHNVA